MRWWLDARRCQRHLQRRLPKKRKSLLLPSSVGGVPLRRHDLLERPLELLAGLVHLKLARGLHEALELLLGRQLGLFPLGHGALGAAVRAGGQGAFSVGGRSNKLWT